MTFKKMISLVLVLTMVAGLVNASIFITPANAAEQTSSYHTLSSQSQLTVTRPATTVAPTEQTKAYYLRANAAGVTYYFKSGTLVSSKALPVTTGAADATAVYIHSYGDGTIGLDWNRASDSKWIGIYGDWSSSDYRTGNATAFNDNYHFTFTGGHIYKTINQVECILTATKLGSTWCLRFQPVTSVGDGIYAVELVERCTPADVWTDNGDGNHYHKCTGCSAKLDLEACTADTDWFKGDPTEATDDQDHHWNICTRCSGKLNITGHIWGQWVYKTGTQERSCTVCGYLQVVGEHTCQVDADHWETDEEQHWRICAICESVVGQKENHTDSTYSTDDGNHWKECTVCAAAYQKDAHSYEPQKDDTDALKHKMVCICGKEADQEDHDFTAGWQTDAQDPAKASLTCAQCGYTETADILPSSMYYLTSGAGDYFCHTGSTNMTALGYHGLGSTNKLSAATQVTVTMVTVDNEIYYLVGYTYGSIQYYLYIDDISSDGKMDAGRTTTASNAARVNFRWDAQNGYLYQMEQGVKYVLAFKTVTPTANGAEELRIVAVPETDIGSDAVALMQKHTCTYDTPTFVEKNEAQHRLDCVCGAEGTQMENHTIVWDHNNFEHWEGCICGYEKNRAEHTCDNWNVEAEPTLTEAGRRTGVCNVCSYMVVQSIPAGPEEGTYMLGNGTWYLQASTSTGETGFHSLHATEGYAQAAEVTVQRALRDGETVFWLSYTNTNGAAFYLYIDDIGVDGVIDTGRTGNTDNAARVDFLWDAENQWFYQVEKGVKYVLALKQLTLTDSGEERMRVYAVTESEITAGTADPVKLEPPHQHTYGTRWTGDDYTHWHACTCGAKSEEAAHTADSWTVEKEPTLTEDGRRSGVCNVCGSAAVQSIPAGPAEGSYMLGNGTWYLVESTSTGETGFHSLHATEGLAMANHVTVYRGERSGKIVFWLSYTDAKDAVWYLYIDDIGADGVMDTGRTSNTDNAARVDFLWDAENQWFYQVEKGVKYVLALKQLTLTDSGEKQMRVYAIPESEITAGTADAAKLEPPHYHTYGTQLAGDDYTHWYPCVCGGKKDEQEHISDNWNVEKEATLTEEGKRSGTCKICGMTVEQILPAGPQNADYMLGNGTWYFMQSRSTGETGFHSLHATKGLVEAEVVTVQRSERNGKTVYWLSYTDSQNKSFYLYVDDIGKDGVIDTGRTSNTDSAARVDFSWDAENQYLYQMESGIKYVLAFKVLSLEKGSGTQMRICAVPESEILDGTASAVRLEPPHYHTYKGNWSADDKQHWKTCACGRKDTEAHTMPEWTILKEATETETGERTRTCSTCGRTVTQITGPILKEKTYYLTNNDENAPWYFVESSGTGETGFHSLHTIQDYSQSYKITVTQAERDDQIVYWLSFTDNSENLRYLYIDDIGSDGTIDVGRTANTDSAARVDFAWDAENQYLYQMEGGVKYVLAFMELPLVLGDGSEMRITAIPEQELSARGAVPARLTLEHIHFFGTEWDCNDTEHFYGCACGERRQVEEHQVEQWTIEDYPQGSKSGTKIGICSICGGKATAIIPAEAEPTEMLKDGAVGSLRANFNGTMYYIRRLEDGQTATSTRPYGLPVTTKAIEAADITVTAAGDAYRLTVGTEPRYISASVQGVVATTNEKHLNTGICDFYYDASVGAVYTKVDGVRYALVLKELENTVTGEQELRMTCMPLDQALTDDSVVLVDLHIGTQVNVLLIAIVLVCVLALGAVLLIVIKKRKK